MMRRFLTTCICLMAAMHTLLHSNSIILYRVKTFLSLGASSSAVSNRADGPGTRLSFARKRQQELGPEVPASKLWGDKGLAPWGVESGCCAPLGNLELRQLRGVPSLRFTSCCYKCCCCHYWLLLAAVFSEIEIGRIRNRILCRSRYFFTIITFEY